MLQTGAVEGAGVWVLRNVEGEAGGQVGKPGAVEVPQVLVARACGAILLPNRRLFVLQVGRARAGQAERYLGLAELAVAGEVEALLPTSQSRRAVSANWRWLNRLR